MHQYLIHLDNADVAIEGKPVLKGLKWQLQKHQHWRIRGVNGAGKSTFLKLIAGYIWPIANVPVSRIYHFNKKPSHLLQGVREHIGYAAYHMIDDYVKNARNIHGYDVIASGFYQSILCYQPILDAEDGRIRQLASKLKISGLLMRPFLSLSEGEKASLLFARAIIHDPSVLILDEIFNGVDSRCLGSMLSLLKQYKDQGGQIVLAWHERDNTILESLFSHEIVFEKGRIIKQSRIDQNKTDAEINTAFQSLSKTLKRLCKSDKPDDDQAPLIEFKNVNLYLANQKILSNINWKINQGDIWLLTGDNGAGKSSLLRLIMAQIRPSVTSQIKRLGHQDRSNVWRIRREIGYVSPELQHHYHYNIRALDVIVSGFYSSIGLYENVTRQQIEKAHAVAARLSLTHLVEKNIESLSSGQMRQVLIARAMVHDPRLMLFDEVMANLDVQATSLVLKSIYQLAIDGITIILTSHHPKVFKGLYNKHLKLEKGIIIKKGNNVSTKPK